MGKVLITGASGFIGKQMCNELISKQFPFTAAVRTVSSIDQLTQNIIATGDMNGSTQWQEALAGIDTVVHLAARAHVMYETVQDPWAEYHAVNVEATLNLAKQAIQAGAKRFIFLSTIKVNGEETHQKSFSPFDVPAPLDFYGKSKLAAELALQALAKESMLELVIIRSPLVYGPHVGANFYKLMQLTQLGLPLPFKGVYNQRSMVALDNLVDLLITCITHPAAAHQTFLVSDDDDLSLSRLVGLIAKAMDKRVWLLPAPIKFIQILAAMVGKSASVNRLFGSLQLDISHTKQTLHWQPIIGVEQGIKKTVQHFLTHQ